MATGEASVAETIPDTGLTEGYARVPSPGSAFRTFPISVDRYQRMIETGCLDEKEPVFLWHGRLVEKMTKGPRHNSSSNKLLKAMDRLMPDGWFTEHEAPLALSDDAMPEPDIKIVRGDPADYEERVPSVQDVALVVEVADSSLAVDSGDVLETYAREAIPVYWIVNLPGRRIDVYLRPTGPANSPHYAEHRSYGPGEEVPVLIDGREVGRIAVDRVLPRGQKTT